MDPNSNFIKAIVIPVLCLLVAVSVMVAILTSGGNIVGQSALYGMIGCFVFGLISPRGSVFLMVFLAAYSDLFKRLLILEGQISMLDLAYVLGMAPAALAGSVVGILAKKILTADFEKRDVLTFGIASVFLFWSAVMSFKSGGGLRSMRDVADYGAFAYLIFVLPVLFPNREAVAKLMKFTLIVFVPVAIYGIWQRVYGLADFEHAYLLTGLSIEDRQLDDVSIRPFSTLNAATSLTMVMAGAVVFCLICRSAGRLSLLMTVLLALLFGVACYMTFTRIGWAVLAASLVFIPLMRSKAAVIALYGFGLAIFLLTVWQAQALRENLHRWQDQIYSSSSTSSDDRIQGLRIVTLSDRLIGFENMKRPENWQPFGVKGEGSDLEGLGAQYSTTFSHDKISGFLFGSGYVPFGVLIVFGALGIYRLHQGVFRLPMERRRFAQLGLAGTYGAGVSLLTGGTMFQFPANIFFWMLSSMVLISMWEGNAIKRMREHALALQEPVASPEAVSKPRIPRGVRHRFGKA
jgi:hypothetical protein